PVAIGDTRPGNPDFANFSPATWSSSVRICNHDASMTGGSAARDDCHRFRWMRLRRFGKAPLQRVRLQLPELRRIRRTPTRDKQRGLGEAIDGIERVPSETGT